MFAVSTVVNQCFEVIVLCVWIQNNDSVSKTSQASRLKGRKEGVIVMVTAGNKRGVRDARRSKGEGDNLTVVFYSLLNGKRLSGTIWTELYTCM